MATLPMQLLAGGVVLFILIWPRITRVVPGSLVALLVSSAFALALGMPVTLLGPLPSGLPSPSLPLDAVTLATLPSLIKSGLVIALLGSIESLMAALVVDEMTGTRHRSDKELFGQGLANVIAPIFGGLAGTGAIVRSAVNVRAGGRTPLASVLHSLLIAAVVLWLGGLAAYIPVPTLWGILIATSIGLVEWESIRERVRAPRGDSAVMLTTTFVTVAEDLTSGVAAGLALSFVLFTLRMSALPVHRKEQDGAVMLMLEGPLFFGVARRFLEQVESVPIGVSQVWDLTHVTSVDATGAAVLKQAREAVEHQGAAVSIIGLQAGPRQVLTRMEVI